MHPMAIGLPSKSLEGEDATAGVHGGLGSAVASPALAQALPVIGLNRPGFAVATIRLEPEIWAEVEPRARRERRPIGTMLRIIVSDAIAPALPGDRNAGASSG
jgi:hypothetical protein